MKIKYLRLSKDERKAAKKAFYNTNSGKSVKKHLTSALICAFLCISISIYIIVDAYMNDLSLWNKIYGFIILGFGLCGLIAYRKIYLKKVNEYVTSNK